MNPTEMNQRSRLFAVLAVGFGLLALAGSVTTRAVAEDVFVKKSVALFDGKTLDGWEGEMKWFRIEDGCVVAGSLKEKIPHNYFLCTKKTYGDFELRLQGKLVGPGQNAGIQFRSKRVEGDTEVSGYQADMGIAWKRPVWGALYDESRRRRMLQEPDPKVAKDALKQDEWNDLRIVARGNHIQIFLNDVKTVDYVEEDSAIERDGVIALQIHSGPATEAWYRNIRLRELK